MHSISRALVVNSTFRLMGDGLKKQVELI